MQNQLHISVLHVSSEASEYPAENLTAGDALSQGWRNERGRETNEEIIFEIQEGLARVYNMQIVTHQQLVPSWIKIASRKTDPDDPTEIWHELGRLKLEAPDMGGKLARQRKTFKLETEARYIRTRFGKAAKSMGNPYEQVGMAAVALFGVPLEDRRIISSHSRERRVEEEKDKNKNKNNKRDNSISSSSDNDDSSSTSSISSSSSSFKANVVEINKESRKEENDQREEEGISFSIRNKEDDPNILNDEESIRAKVRKIGPPMYESPCIAGDIQDPSKLGSYSIDVGDAGYQKIEGNKMKRSSSSDALLSSHGSPLERGTQGEDRRETEEVVASQWGVLPPPIPQQQSFEGENEIQKPLSEYYKEKREQALKKKKKNKKMMEIEKRTEKNVAQVELISNNSRREMAEQNSIKREKTPLMKPQITYINGGNINNINNNKEQQDGFMGKGTCCQT